MAAHHPLTQRKPCAEGCTLHGTCHEELGRCDCPIFRTGPACAELLPDAQGVCKAAGLSWDACTGIKQVAPCLNSCNLRGTCVGGFCHCLPGHFGADCALSVDESGEMLLLAGQNYTQRLRGPRIYVYELPSSMAWINFAKLDRPLHLLLWQRLASAGVRTLDAASADYFYLPLNTRFKQSATLMAALGYVRSTWPWWNETQGRRHLIMHTGDLGVTELFNRTWGRQDFMREAGNAIWLTHWGLTEDHPKGLWPAAHRPGQDIVIPVQFNTISLRDTTLHPSAPPGAGAGPPGADGNCGSKGGEYSAGTRQKVYFHHHQRSNYTFLAHAGHALLPHIAASRYCLAPTGGGHGKRQVLAAALGCVPVTVTDNVLQPFEPELDWGKFSVAVAESAIPQLHLVLDGLKGRRLAAMQVSGPPCAAQHMLFSGSLGSVLGDDGRFDAFETLMAILLVRLRHPTLPPSQYTAVDQAFRRFAACQESDENLVNEASQVQGPVPLCSHSPWPHLAASPLLLCSTCRQQRRPYFNQSNWYGVIGGAQCCAETVMTRCPREWA
ncbi:MAG: hypothetical protein WDW38_008443 [Sanguina aurantia]